MFGVETWGGARKPLLKKVQVLQDKVTKLSLPKEQRNKNKTETKVTELVTNQRRN